MRSTRCRALQTDPARHYLVRYEDLCDSPARTVTDICSWLGVAPPEEPTMQTVLGGRHTKSLPIKFELEGRRYPGAGGVRYGKGIWI